MRTTESRAAPNRNRSPLSMSTRSWIATTLVNNLGDGISQVGFQVLLATRGHGPNALALSFGANQVGLLVMAIVGGHLVDAWSRTRILVRTNLARAAVIGCVALAVGLDIPWLLSLVIVAQFALGSLELVADGAAESLLPSVSADDELDRASGLLGAAETAANSFIGPPIGAALAGIGIWLCFGIDALSYGIAAAGFSFVLSSAGRQDMPQSTPGTEETMDKNVRPLLAGFRFVGKNREVRAAVTVAVVMAISYTAVLSQAYLIAERLVLVDGRWFGLIFALEAMGFVISGLAFGRLKTSASQLLTFAVVASGGGLVVIALVGTPVVIGIALIANGLGNGLIVSYGMAVRIRVSPDHLRGRIQTAYRSLMIFGSLLGAVAGGALMSRAGATATVLTAGVFLLGTGGVAALATVSTVHDPGTARCGPS